MEEYNEDKRFFIINFTGITDDNERQRGKIHMFTDGSYVNEAFIHSTIEKQFKLKDPYITNVMEMDVEDFADFTASEEEYKEIPFEDYKPKKEEKKPSIDIPAEPKKSKDDLDDYI